ncbi:MAG: ImmA/IrrE family metallo-endopeptidase [Planctomycetes bacterium]|nr:ImmA/IrrE family metallo-endopeptidase [Planctomycetota bacterium]
MNRLGRPRHRRRRLGAEARAEIAELAAAVADAHCPAERVAPERIARAKAVTLSWGRYGPAFDGMLEHLDGRFHIYVNLDRVGRPDAPRARFTLAHELGHYYLDAHRRALAAGRAPAHRSRCDWESPNLAEQEADHFAAHLLMPAGRFGRALDGVPLDLSGVIALALRFGASLTAAALRTVACSAAPCAVVKWNWSGVSWARLSSAAFTGRLGAAVDAPARLPDDAPTRRALAGEVPPAEGFFTAGATAATWFSAVAPGSRRDVLLIEQAIPLGRYGVLTFLRLSPDA